MNVMVASMMNIDQIFMDLGGTGKVAKFLGVKPSSASEMRRRGSVPVKYWPALVAACDEQNVEGINYATLVSLHSDKVNAA